MSNLEGRLRIILSQKSQIAALRQQEGALRFYLQDELTKGRVITLIKRNLKGDYDKEGNPYDHRATGYLESSIYPVTDNPQGWTGDLIKSRLVSDGYLGLAIDVEQFSVYFKAASYAEKLNDGFTAGTLTADSIKNWIYSKARRNPTSKWYAAYPRKEGYETYRYYGDQVTTSVAKYIAKPIVRKLKTVGYKGSGWLEFLQGPAGFQGALKRAYMRYLKDYPSYTWATITYKIEETLEKIGL